MGELVHVSGASGTDLSAPGGASAVLSGSSPVASFHEADELVELRHGRVAHVVGHVLGDSLSIPAFEIAKDSLSVAVSGLDVLVEKTVANLLSGATTCHE